MATTLSAAEDNLNNNSNNFSNHNHNHNQHHNNWQPLQMAPSSPAAAMFENTLANLTVYAQSLTADELIYAHELLTRLDGQLWWILCQLAHKAQLSAPPTLHNGHDVAAKEEVLTAAFLNGGHDLLNYQELCQAPPVLPPPLAPVIFESGADTGANFLVPPPLVAGLGQPPPAPPSAAASSSRPAAPKPRAHHGTGSGGSHLYECKVCGRHFAQGGTVARHIRTMHSAALWPELCARCGRRFVTRSQLNGHFCDPSGASSGQVDSQPPLPPKPGAGAELAESPPIGYH